MISWYMQLSIHHFQLDPLTNITKTLHRFLMIIITQQSSTTTHNHRPPSTIKPPYTATMDDNKHNKKKQKHNHSNSNYSFKPSSKVKGLRFGGQLITKSFTIRRATPLELHRLLTTHHHHPSPEFLSTTAFIPTNFTILAHHAWHTLTLGLGTQKSKVVLFVFESETMKTEMDRVWPGEIPLGEVHRKLIKGLTGCEMARFKFRKGCITFYVYAVRRIGSMGFACGMDLRVILESVVSLNDFLDHTAMLAMPKQRSIGFVPPTAYVH